MKECLAGSKVITGQIGSKAVGATQEELREGTERLERARKVW